MSEPRIITELRTYGIELKLENGKLRCRDPGKKMSPELREEILAHKAEVLQYLQGEAPRHYPLTEEDVARFERAGKRYCIQTANGQVWLVPKRTMRNRVEVTARQLFEALQEGKGDKLRDSVSLIWEALGLFDGKIINQKEAS